jgi:hypothetical protein
MAFYAFDKTNDMQNDKDELQEQHGSEKNNDKPIGVDDQGNPVVPPNIDKGGDGAGTTNENERGGSGNDTVGVP